MGPVILEPQPINTFLPKITSPQALAQWLLQSPHQYRPRWWIRNILNRFTSKVSRKAIIRRTARLDIFPYKRFEVGDYSIIEDKKITTDDCMKTAKKFSKKKLNKIQKINGFHCAGIMRNS